MLVSRVQSTNLPKSLIKKNAPKVSEAAKKLGQIVFNEVKLDMPKIEKMSNLKIYAGSGGSVCTDTYSIEAPDSYIC